MQAWNWPRAGLTTVLLCTAAGGVLLSQPPAREVVGPLASGGFLLNTGWRLDPVGKQAALDSFPMATAVTPDGRHLIVLSAGRTTRSLSAIDTATAAVVSTARVADAWLGLTISPNGDRVYAGGGSQAAVWEFALAGGKLEPSRTFAVVPGEKRGEMDFIGDVTLSPDGRLLYAADIFRDSVVAINPQSGMTINRFKTGRRPYRILFHPDGQSFFVTHWADGTLGHYNARDGSPLATLRIGAHPTDIVFRPGGPPDPAPGEPVWVARLFVAAANTNNVYAVGLNAAKELRILESINVSMTARQPLGMTPSALALSPDGGRLFVACSDANVAAVVNVSLDRSVVEGFIPVGWYPTAVRVLRSGALAVLNGKGAGAQTGSASFIDPFTDEQFGRWTQAAFTQSPYRDSVLESKPQAPPIQNVIYIVRGSHTYDQVLGDVKEGNGDASLAAFGGAVTPNYHKLAREFVLFDNFYVNGDGAAEGYQWSTAAIASDFVRKLGRIQDPTAQPPAGYLWTNAVAAGIAIRNFGHMAGNGPAVSDPVLAKVTNPSYSGPEGAQTDSSRAQVFLKEFAEYEKSGVLPRLILMRLGSGPDSKSAADSDYALGTIVEAVSKSRFWNSTAIFVVEQNAGGGKDHVDSHRSPALAVSAFSRRGVVDSTMYNSASALRTIELILGLRPMTQFDAAARPMLQAFQQTPDPAPYTAEKTNAPRAAAPPRFEGKTGGNKRAIRYDEPPPAITDPGK